MPAAEISAQDLADDLFAQTDVEETGAEAEDEPTVAAIPERSLKRRFKAATGTTLIGYVQNLRVEEAKRRLESELVSFEEIAADLGYENLAFFRRLFKRATGLTPSQYRRMFRPFVDAGGSVPSEMTVETHTQHPK